MDRTSRFLKEHRTLWSSPRHSARSRAKFSVDDGFAMPDLSLTGARVVRQPAVNLAATYFDTEDLRLARFGVTLRRRTGGTDEGWHLKLPDGNRTILADEVHLPLHAGRANKVPPRS